MRNYILIGLFIVLLFLITYLKMFEKIRSFVPFMTRISGKFGPRINPVTNEKQFHNGIDIAAILGTPVLSYNEGECSVFYNEIGGNQVTIQGPAYRTGYAHLQNVLVKSGQVVKKGQQIAEIGNTGRSTGPHLHFTYTKKGLTTQSNPEELFKLT